MSWGKFRVLGPIETTKGGELSGQLEKNDYAGDPYMDIIEGKYRLVYHTTGIVYLDKAYNGDPLNGWPDPIIKKLPVGTKSLAEEPRYQEAERARLAIDTEGIGHANIDTPCLVKKPGPKEPFVIYHSANPGARPKAPREIVTYAGTVFVIQRATAASPTSYRQSWDKQPWTAVFAPEEVPFLPLGSPPPPPPPTATWEGPYVTIRPDHRGYYYEFNGGVLEQSVLFDPDLDAFVMFYGGLAKAPPGNPFRRNALYRLGRAESKDGVTWTRTPAGSSESFVWGYEQESSRPWGGYPQAHHFSVSRRPLDGSYHLVMLGADSAMGVPHPESIGHWHSVDKGFTWLQDNNNPIITWATLERATGDRDWTAFTPVPGGKLGSPHMFFDEKRAKAYVSFDGGPRGRYTAFGYNSVPAGKRSRIWVAEASTLIRG